MLMFTFKERESSSISWFRFCRVGRFEGNVLPLLKTDRHKLQSNRATGAVRKKIHVLLKVN
jgi:hypothetical protein